MQKLTFRPYPGALLNPLMDSTFKALFTENSKESRAALTSFLSAIFVKTVTNVVLQENELSKESVTDKGAVFDITCLVDGEPVNIEMQGLNINNMYQKRAEYHVAHLLNHYVKEGTEWEDVPKVFQISVVNFIIDPAGSNFVSHYQLKKDDGTALAERLNVIFIELPKVKKISNTNVKSLTPIECWSKFLTCANKPKEKDFISSLAEQEEGIMQAATVLRRISEDDQKWLEETRQFMAQMDHNTFVNAARRAQQELNNTQEKLNTTKDKLNSTQDKLNSTQDKLNSTQDKLNSTQDKLNSTQDKLNSTQSILERTIKALLSQNHSITQIAQITGLSESEIESYI